jgi:hypothetical protein
MRLRFATLALVFLLLTLSDSRRRKEQLAQQT